jgi:glutamine synthetase
VPELGSDGQRMFVELRAADPSCNPYLALAAALKAGLEGIAQQLDLPEPVEERAEAAEQDASGENAADPLPQTLGEAIEELEWDPVARAALGQSIYERFLAAKEQEWAAYRNHISLWELETYLQGA